MIEFNLSEKTIKCPCPDNREGGSGCPNRLIMVGYVKEFIRRLKEEIDNISHKHRETLMKTGYDYEQDILSEIDKLAGDELSK